MEKVNGQWRVNNQLNNGELEEGDDDACNDVGGISLTHCMIRK